MSTRYNFFGGLVTDNLILNLDAAKLQSYPGSGTNWINLINNSISGGTLINGPTLTGSGKNLAITFDGTNDYTTIPTFLISPSSFTCDSFFQWSNLGSSRGSIFSLNYDYPNSGYLIIQKDDGSGKFVIWSDYGNETGIFSNNAIKINEWYNVVVTQSGDTCFIYLNGSLDSIQSLPKPVLNQSYQILLGVRAVSGTSAGAYMTGRIATSKIYNKALSPFEVYQNFNALKGRYDIPDIVTSGLTLNLDAGNPYSYNPLNTGSTTWVDTTYTTTGGTLINGTSYSGGTMVFDGTDDYVQVGTSAVVNESLPFTVSFWMKLTELVNGKTAPFIFKTNSGANFILIFGENSSQYKGTVLIVPGASAAVKTDTNTSFFLNNWVNITVTYNGLGATTPSNYVIYENTVLKNQNTGVGGVADPRVNTIFGYLNSNNVMKGNVSLMQIYNRALSQAEITQNFNATRGRYGV
jgi:hypothetical protein